MKQLFRNLVCYSIDIPTMALHSREQVVEELNNILPDFVEIGEHQRACDGFTPMVDGGSLAQLVPGGWAVRFRVDTKAVPASEVAKELTLRKKSISESTGRVLGKKEIAELKADIIHDLLPRAFPRSAGALAIYSEKTGRLYVSNPSSKVCDRLMSALVRAVESLKTSTLHVSEPAASLTNRLNTWLADEDNEVFADFSPRDEVVMKSKATSRKWAIKVDNPMAARATLMEALEHGGTVDSIGFVDDDDGVRFRITSALRVKGLSVPKADSRDKTDGTEADVFCAQAAVELHVMDGIFTRLLQLFETAPKVAETDDDATAAELARLAAEDKALGDLF